MFNLSFFKKAGLFIIIISLAILFFFSCKEDKKSGADRPYTLETAKMVSEVTSGMLSPDDVVQVKFVSEMVKATQTGQSLKKEVFIFDPEIDGITQWKDRRTLIFKPNERLPFREKYSTELNLNALFPEFTEKDLETLSFKFQVAGREIASFEGDFSLIKEDDPGLVQLKGKISFTEETETTALKSAADLISNKKDISIKWHTESDQKTFSFISDLIKRSNSEKEFTFSIDKDKLDISRTFLKTFILPAVKDFKITDIIIDSEGKKPQVRIEFSDQLKAHQELSGFISIKPDIDFKLTAIQKQIIVRADFLHGEEYSLTVEPGLRSRWANKLKNRFQEKLQFEDMLPEIRFANDGVYLPSDNRKTVLFQTVNIKRVKLKIIKVFESNLGQFLQMERLSGARERREDFYYNISRVGMPVYEDDLEIGSTRNSWLQHELDLNKLIKPEEKGLFLLSLRFRKDDMLYDTSEENLQYRRRQSDWYYNDPASYGYIYSHGQVFKPLILSDIGLTYKKGKKQHYIYASNILDTKPLSGVHVKLWTYQNQLINEGFTDGQGIVVFKDIEEKVFFISAEKNGQRSAIKAAETAWNISTFDTKGIEVRETGMRAFIYTERGVYRPGDPLNISAIIRNQENTFPENHPVTIKIFNPKNQVVHEETRRDGTDGFYNFPFSTNPEDLTGNYRVELKAGSQNFYHTLRIETVVPERLKIKFENAPKTLSYNDKKIMFDLSCTYLFGNPAANLEAEVSLTLQSASAQFAKYSDYSFVDRSAVYHPRTHTIFSGKLNAQGKAAINKGLPSLENAPGALKGLVKARVLEKGGRDSKNQFSVNINPFPYYVGLKKPDMRYGYVPTNQELSVTVIMLDPQGKETPGQTLNYKIYHNERHWWWEYDSRENYRLRYKKDVSTTVAAKGTLISGIAPVLLNFTPKERGQYLIEVQDANEKGHASSLFIRAYPWGKAPSTGKDAGILALKADKETYNPGQTAKVSFPVPEKASVLMTIEKGYDILESKWYKADGQSDEMRIEIPVTKEMLPNAYVSVSVIQPHAQTSNDRPIRMYGIVPLNVEVASTRQGLQIEMSDELQPEKEFEVTLQTTDQQPTQLTVAVVDEGLLSLTRFTPPDPWKAFFQKQRLGILTYDLFSQVIGANKGDIFKTFSIGGGVMEDKYRKGQLEEQKAKRFKPVCLFKGPLMTDANGKVTVSFKMPNYVGAVRVMAAAASGNRYGHAEKSVPVKTDLMVVSTLPRLLGPGDRFIVPVTVFAMKDNTGVVDISLQIEGPLDVIGKSKSQRKFTETGEKEILFTVRAKSEVGVGKIHIKAASADNEAFSETEISVRASSPLISESEDKTIAPGDEVEFTIPDKGLSGTNKAAVIISRRPNIKLTRRILWLIRYPYGCIEQTVSSVFPQLYLQEFIPKSRAAGRDIDKNINVAIQRLRHFQTPSGAFSYWPGSRNVSDWGSAYAGHFMVEARKSGYSVPAGLYDPWIKHLKSQSRENDDNLMTEIYRLYILALAGDPQIGPMNLLKENKIEKLNNTQRWLLAAAYKLAGVEHTANKILINAGTEVKDYMEFGGTYGSTLRDKSLILSQMVLFERWETAKKLADELAVALSSQSWYSTQTSGFMLLSLGKYLKALEGEDKGKKKLAGAVILPNGQKTDFETDKIKYQMDIEEGFGKKVKIILDEKSNIRRAFASLEWSGKPITYIGKDESHNLKLLVEWLDEDGMKIDPVKIRQGETFWAHFRINKPKEYRNKIEEIALVQLLPSGWEIDNTRLSGETMPGWMRRWKLNREEYLDIRDDRIMWFFDLPRYQHEFDFVVKLNTVTVGEFLLPPTLVEAMYNNSYKAIKAGRKVEVLNR